MTRVEYLRPGRTARGWRRWSAIDAAALAGIGGPVVFLIFRRGGAAVEDFSAASALALAAVALAVLMSGLQGRTFHVPWPMAAILALPFVQLIPFGPFVDILVSKEIRQLKSAIARLGVDPPSTISLYPLATLRSWIVAAGCCAVFALASAAVKRLPRKWPLALAPLAAAGVFEALLGLRQYLHAGAEQAATLISSHGTFANRDHFAVLLEACLGIAIGLALAGLHGVRRKGWLSSGGSLLLGGTAFAALSLTGIVLSSSRAGIATGVLLMALGLFAAVFSDSRRRLARRAPLALALGAAALVALHAALPAKVAERFEALWENQGDPVRLAIWADTWHTAQSYFWAGSGLGTFGSAFQRSSVYVPRAHVDHAHSDYLELLVELGFPATIFLAAVPGVVIGKTLRNIRRTPDAAQRWLRGGCLLGAGAILLHAAVDFPLRVPALALVFAALAGFADGGGTREPDAGSSRWHGPRAAALAGLVAAMAALAVWTGFGNTKSYDAEALFIRAEAASVRGDRKQAEALYQEASGANSFAAGVWLKRAEAAGLAGDDVSAEAYLALARRIEPFTFRTEWPFLQRQLREGQLDEASPALAALAHAMPGARPGIYASALGAGIDVENVARQIVPPEPNAGDEFVKLLVERRRWDGIVPAVRVLRERAHYSPPADTLRAVLDRLFAAEETSAMVEMAEAIAAGSGQDAAFPWLVRPLEGVSVSLGSGSAAPRVEIDFESSANIAFGHIYRYFAVRASQQYIVEAQARTDTLTGGEAIRIAVRSPKRTLAVSPGLRGSTPWQTTRLAFVAGPADRVIRVEIMRPRGPRADDVITGRFFLKKLRVIERGGSAT